DRARRLSKIIAVGRVHQFEKQRETPAIERVGAIRPNVEPGIGWQADAIALAAEVQRLDRALKITDQREVAAEAELDADRRPVRQAFLQKDGDCVPLIEIAVELLARHAIAVMSMRVGI